LPVAKIGHLIAMKVLSLDARRRPQDWDDIMSLFRVANATELQAALRALQTIVQRGFSRSKNLLDDFLRLKSEFDT
jgi:uncharacterized protein with PhoU and TrkA domain